MELADCVIENEVPEKSLAARSWAEVAGEPHALSSLALFHFVRH